MKNSFTVVTVCQTPTCELNLSSTIQIASTSFLLVFLIVLAGISLFGEFNSCIAQIDNQRISRVVTARVQSYVQSCHHQHRDLHQSSYLYLSEDRDPTSHQVVSDFRLPVRYYHVSFSLVVVFHS
jgi:hypothetical protein